MSMQFQQWKSFCIEGKVTKRLGVQIIMRGLEAPVKQIAANAGVDGSVVLDRIKASGNWWLRL